MKKSDYSLIIEKDYNNKRIYSLIRFHKHSDEIDTELRTNNKYEMKMKLDLMGLKIKNYQFRLWGEYIQVWFK